MAGFGWIDFSEKDRNRVLSVISLLKDGGTIDELGIGVVRDAFSDWLFPGLSTIQTRPKYFIILAQILLNYLREHRQKKKLPSLKEYLRREENKVMHWLAKKYGNNQGVIGIHVAKRNEELVRKPSSIYWRGLRLHGIIDSQATLSQYLQQNDLSTLRFDHHKEEPDESDAWALQFGITLPHMEAIDESVVMELSEQEAAYLKDKFTSRSLQKEDNNLLRHILLDEDRMETMLAAKNFEELGEVLLKDEGLPVETRKIIRYALDFDLLIYGANIRFNIMLHQEKGTANFEERWQKWLDRIQKQPTIQALDFDFIFSKLAPNTKAISRLFMKDWKKAVLGNKPVEILDELVRNQEINNKGKKAKLISSGEYEGWVGIDKLEYRFLVAKRLVTDLSTVVAGEK